MKMSDLIEQFLLDMLEEESDITLQRNELATKFRCAPSQINYVITTRFTDQRGYEVESRRGGGGYIKIRKIDCSDTGYMMHVINTIGSSIDILSVRAILENMTAMNIITEREAKIMYAALSDRSVSYSSENKDSLRAAMFKNMLICLV